MENKIIYHHKVVHDDIPRLELASRLRIQQSIKHKLSDVERAFDLPLHGKLKGLYKLKVGEYRVVYTRTKGQVFVILIAHRREVYEIVKRRIGL